MTRHRKIRWLLALMVLGLLGTGVPGAGAEEMPVAKDDFQGGGAKQWLWYGDIRSGELILTSAADTRYAGAQTLLVPHITVGGDNDQATHIHLKVNGIDAVDGKPVAAEARIFIEPEPLKIPTFADPYSDPDALTVLVSADGTSGMAKVSLFRKTAQKEPGYGTLLYAGSVPLENFPLKVDWYLSRKAYKIELGESAQTIDGSKQGTYELDSPWDGDLRFIMRIVNLESNVKSRLRIADFAVTTGPIPAQ